MASVPWTVDIERRAIRIGDVAAWARLCGDVARADGLDGGYGEEDLAQRLSHPGLDLQHDTLGAFGAGGEMVGFALVVALPAAGRSHIVSIPGAVDPSWRSRGIGRRLLAWQVARGEALHDLMFPEKPGLLVALCPEGASDYQRLYAHAGLEPVRWVHRMVRDLWGGPPIGDPVDVPGLVLRAVDPRIDLEPVRRAHNEAFSTQWEASELTPEFWRSQRMGSPAFRPALSFVAVDPDKQVAGYLLSYVHDSGRDGALNPVVELGQIGTRATYRGEGVGSALVAAALRSYRAAGFHAAELHVDGANPTGAVGFYERHGFISLQSQARYVRRIPAAEPADER